MQLPSRVCSGCLTHTGLRSDSERQNPQRWRLQEPHTAGIAFLPGPRICLVSPKSAEGSKSLVAPSQLPPPGQRRHYSRPPPASALSLFPAPRPALGLSNCGLQRLWSGRRSGRRHTPAWAGFLEQLPGSASRSVGLRHPSLTGTLWPSTVVLDVTWPWKEPGSQDLSMTTYFSTSLVLCRHMGRGQHPSTPTPAPSRHRADRGSLTELGNVLARQNPRASFQASPRPEEETWSQGNRVFWPQATEQRGRSCVPGPSRAALPPVSCVNTRVWNVPHHGTYTATRPSPSYSHPDPLSRQAFSESHVPTSLPARPGQNKTLCVCKTWGGSFTTLRGPFGSIKVLSLPTVHRSGMVPENSEGNACLGGKLPSPVVWAPSRVLAVLKKQMTITEDNDENRKGHSYPEAPQLDASSRLLLVPSPCVQKLAESSQLLASRKMPKSHLPPPGSAGSGLDPGWCLFWKHSTGALVLWHLNSSLASTELLESKPDGEWAGRSSPREHSFPASHLASVLTKRKSNSCVSEYAHFKKKKSRRRTEHCQWLLVYLKQRLNSKSRVQSCLRF